MRGDKKQINLFSYPREMADHLGNQDTKSMLKNQGKLIKEAASLEKEMRLGGSRSGRLFLLYVQSPVNKFLWLHLKEKIPSYRIRMIGKFKQSLLGSWVSILLINFKGGGSD